MTDNIPCEAVASVSMMTGTQGYVEFRNGQKLWTATVQRDGELFKVRIDMGIYHEVDVNGKVKPQEDGPHDIVKFDPKMKWLEAMRRHIPTEIRLC